MTDQSSIDPEGPETYRSNVLLMDPEDPAEMLAYRRKFFSQAKEKTSWYDQYGRWTGEIHAIREAIARLDPDIATKALDRLNELEVETKEAPSLTMAVNELQVAAKLSIQMAEGVQPTSHNKLRFGKKLFDRQMFGRLIQIVSSSTQERQSRLDQLTKELATPADRKKFRNLLGFVNQLPLREKETLYRTSRQLDTLADTPNWGDKVREFLHFEVPDRGYLVVLVALLLLLFVVSMFTSIHIFSKSSPPTKILSPIQQLEALEKESRSRPRPRPIDSSERDKADTPQEEKIDGIEALKRAMRKYNEKKRGSQK